MASKTSTIKVNITGDARDALKAINQTTGEMMTMQQKTASAVGGMANAIASAGVIQKLGEIGTACVNAAADLQQSVGGVETVFESSADQMLAWADQAAQAVGLSKNEYNEFATLIGSQLQNFGMSVEDSASKTNDLISLGADLSSMFGGTTADAVDALSAALKGEMDPIEKYGISLNDATLQAQAASMGLLDLYKSGDRNAKMQATLAAVTAQSGKAVGNFSREADTAQGQQQRMNAAWENAKASLGEALLPALTAAAAALAQLGQWVQQNSAWLTPFAVVLGVVAAAILGINAAMGAYAAVSAAVAVAQGAVNLAFLPVTAIIMAIVATIVLLAANWGTVSEAARRAAEWIHQKWDGMASFFQGVGQSLRDSFAGPINTVVEKFEWLKSKAQAALDWIGGLWNKATGWISGASAQSMYASPYMAQTAAFAYTPVRAVSAFPAARAADMALPRASALAWSAAAVRPTVIRETRTYEIHVDGTVVDKEGTAQAIRRLLADYERRRS